MDAKAKVVVWLIELPGGLKYPATDKRIADAAEAEGITVTPLIPLTDHEAALAELAERHAATERNACLMAELANDEKNKRLTLLTGLEALAGECEADAETLLADGKKLAAAGWHSEAEDCRHYAKDAKFYAARIRTLTNSAKD